MLFRSGKEEWKKVYALSLLCIWIPEFSYTYTLMLMIPPLLMYLKNNNGSFRYIYQFCFIVILMPLYFPKLKWLDFNVKFPLTLPTAFINIAICILTIMILIEDIMIFLYKNGGTYVKNKNTENFYTKV